MEDFRFRYNLVHFLHNLRVPYSFLISRCDVSLS